jgi:hypothetical protein
LSDLGFAGISVSFTPSTFEDQTGKVTLTDNAADRPQTVPITGNGAEAAVLISPTSLSFGSQKVGTTEGKWMFGRMMLYNL